MRPEANDRVTQWKCNERNRFHPSSALLALQQRFVERRSRKSFEIPFKFIEEEEFWMMTRTVGLWSRLCRRKMYMWQSPLNCKHLHVNDTNGLARGHRYTLSRYCSWCFCILVFLTVDNRSGRRNLLSCSSSQFGMWVPCGAVNDYWTGGRFRSCMSSQR